MKQKPSNPLTLDLELPRAVTYQSPRLKFFDMATGVSLDTADPNQTSLHLINLHRFFITVSHHAEVTRDLSAEFHRLHSDPTFLDPSVVVFCLLVGWWLWVLISSSC